MAKILLQRAGFNFSPHMVAYNCLQLHIQGIRHPRLTSTGTSCMWPIGIHAVRIPLHTQNNKKKKIYHGCNNEVSLGLCCDFTAHNHMCNH